MREKKLAEKKRKNKEKMEHQEKYMALMQREAMRAIIDEKNKIL